MATNSVRWKPNRRLLKRSFSVSDIPTKKVQFKDKFIQGCHGRTLVRHFSCEEICNDKYLGVGKVIQEVHMPWDKGSDSISIRENPNHSASSMLRETPVVHKSLPPIENETVAEKIKYWFNVLFPLIIALITLCILHTQLQENKCDNLLDVEKVEYTLKSDVFGQKAAVGKIITALKDFVFERDVRFHALVFSGATGVGKSFVASTISEHFPQPKNVQFIVLQAYTDFDALIERVQYRLSYCGNNLVVIDGVGINNINQGLALLNKLHDYTVSDKYIHMLVILLVNLQEGYHFESSWTSYNNVLRANDLKLQAAIELYEHNNLKFIPFNQLNENHMLRCIETFLSQQNICLSDEILNDIDEIRLPLLSGCKGIISKVQVLLKESL